VSVGGDGGDDEARVQLLECFVVDTEGPLLCRQPVVDDNVHLTAELMDDVLGGEGLEIERDALLVGVQPQKEAAFLQVRHVAQEWTLLAGLVAHACGFHLDNFRPQVRHHLGGVGSGNVLAQLQDSDV